MYSFIRISLKLWSTVLIQFLYFFASFNALSLNLRPQGQKNPEDPVFHLFTRRNPTQPQILELGNTAQLIGSNFNIELPTKIYAHGYLESPASQDHAVRNSYLRHEDCNFVAIDWSVLAQGDWPFVARNNAPIAGALTGAFIDNLVDFGAPLDSFHVIGFSLGAHVAAAAVNKTTKGKISRVTGIDPAGEEFMDSDSKYLDVTDGSFVDVIRTGTYLVPGMGHVEFLPNGGYDFPQPGCVNTTIECCSHCRSVYLWAESITSTIGFRSLKCDSYQSFQSGECDNNDVAYMGNPAANTARGYYYLYTNANSPYAQG